MSDILDLGLSIIVWGFILLVVLVVIAGTAGK